jgi:hypothetical protein
VESKWITALRWLYSGFFIVVGTLFLWLAVALPGRLHQQAKDDRLYYQQFERAAGYAARYAEEHNGRLPSDESLQKLGDSDDRGIWGSLSSSGPCDAGFEPAASDRFTLWFWRGEWSECFAYPSGRTTLPMSLMGYLQAGLGIQLAIYLALAIAAAFGAFLLLRPIR